MQKYSDILVSVVMPVYNGALYLREAIDSILSQTHSNLELIIINDGSTDDSEQIILSYADKRIVYLKNEVNSRICITLNRGLDVARGKYIARMDCDDISVPERLQKQLEYMEQHPSFGIIGSDIIVFGKDVEERLFTYEHDKNCCKAGLIFYTCFAHPAVMMRKSLLDEYGFRYDDAYRGFEDIELWYRMSKHTELVNIPVPLLFYRRHKSQETQNASPEVVSKHNNFLCDKILEYITLHKGESSLLVAYTSSDWNFFNNENIHLLISIFRRIICSRKITQDKELKRGMRVTLSKAVAYTIMNSKQITISRRVLYTKSLFCGIMPFDWYLKFMYHTFI